MLSGFFNVAAIFESLQRSKLKTKKYQKIEKTKSQKVQLYILTIIRRGRNRTLHRTNARRAPLPQDHHDWATTLR